MALCCCPISLISAELKLGQNIHKNSVPIIANMSDVYEAPSSEPVAFSFDFVRNIRLTAKPKYAPNAWTVIEPPISAIYLNGKYQQRIVKWKKEQLKVWKNQKCLPLTFQVENVH